MDDKTALAVWAEFSKRVTTQGVEEAAALVQFTDWVRRMAGTVVAAPVGGEAADAE